MYIPAMPILLDMARPRRLQSAGIFNERLGARHADRRFPHHDIVFNMEGRRVLYEEGTRYELGPGDLLFLFAHRHHYSIEPTETSLRTGFLHLYTEPGDAWLPSTADDGGGKLILSSKLGTRGQAAFRALFEETVYLHLSPESLERRKAEALLAAILYEWAILTTAPRTESAGIHRVKVLLARAGARRLSLGSLAREAGMSERTLTRRFRQATGKSPHAFHQEARLNLAARILIARPDVTLRELALITGFSDEFHLGRRFKAHFGQTPARYRREPRAITPA